MKFTKRSVETIEARHGRFFAWDDELKGFGLRVEASGRKTFVCRYRAGGTRRQYTVGRFGVVTVDQARQAARRILGSVSLGEDPGAVRQAGRSAIRFRDLVEAFLEGHGPRLKPGTYKDYESALHKHANLVLGNLAAEAITPSDINRLHLKLSDRPYRANRVVAYTGSVFSWAGRNGFVPKGFNPTTEVVRFKEPSRERYLTTDELERLGAALDQAETDGLPWEIKALGETAKHVPKTQQRIVYPAHVTAAIRLYLLTGCRVSEILNARWQDADLERGFLWLPDSKTGKRPVLLNSGAVAILAGLPRLGSYIIAGSDPGNPRHDLKKPWAQIRHYAGLDDVRLHDLRHTHASIGAGAGLGLPIVGKLLGHKSPQTTERYAHLADDPLRRGAELVGERVGKALGGKAR